MKIVSQLEATPSRVIGLLKLLGDQKRWVLRTRVDALMSPPGLRQRIEAKKAKNVVGDDDDEIGEGGLPTAITATIGALTELGLVIERGKARKELSLAGELPADLDGYRNAFARVLLAPEHDDKPNDVARLIAWLLSLPVAKIPQGHSALKAKLNESKLALGMPMNNNSRWDTLLYWVRFLGLGWQTSDTKCVGIVPDPTAFLRRHLETLVPPGEEVPIKEFRQRLGALCPVLDGGAVRASVLAEIGQDGERLSSALSFALSRFMADGVMKVWCPDDQRPDSFLLMDLSRDTKVAFVARGEK